jgi:hypothetical protein
MNRVLIAVAGLVAFLSEASATWAFTTQPVSRARDRDFGASHANSFREPEAPALQD